MTKIYVTRYALTTGISAEDAKVEGTMAVVNKAGSYPQYFHSKDFHLDAKSALDRAEEMRIAKLKSLDKQIKKVSAIKFEIKE